MSPEEYARCATREDAAAYALAESDVRFPDIRAIHAIQAADVHDAAHGIHRVSLDEETVERAAVALYVHNNPVGNWSAHSARVKTPYRDAARAVLAAAVEAGQ